MNDLFIKKYFESKKDCEMDIDDITWNDLDMGRFFECSDKTKSIMGQEIYYSSLRKPYVPYEVRNARKKRIDTMTKDESFAKTTADYLGFLGKNENYSFYDSIDQIPKFSLKRIIFHAICCLLFVSSFTSIFIWPLFGILFFVFVMFHNMLQYFWKKDKVTNYYAFVSYVLRLLYISKKICAIKSSACDEERQQMKDICQSLSSLQKRSFLIYSAKGGSGNPLDIIFMYIRMLTHIDMIDMYVVLRKLNASKDKIFHLYELTGELDMAQSMALFLKEAKESVCSARFYENETIKLSVKEVYHPLLKKPVTNDVELKKGMLLTGSNASGKSTFLRTIALNMMLAQEFGFAFAKSYEATPMRIFTSIAISDDLSQGDSYFIAEIKSIKRIMQQMKKDIPILCIVDEVLRGTNTLERIAASCEVLRYFAKGKCLCLAATHDGELTSLLANEFDNYHFEETIRNDKVTFDYVLQKGKANSSNALALLTMIGYDQSIIDEARKRIDVYQTKGIWA